MNVRVCEKGVNVVKLQKPRCRCGECPDLSVVVKFKETGMDFEKGLYWLPTYTELKAITESIKAVDEYNIQNNKYCYKVDERARGVPYGVK